MDIMDKSEDYAMAEVILSKVPERIMVSSFGENAWQN